MIIQNGTLTNIDASDINPDGVLRIPPKVTGVADNVGCNIPNMRAIYFPNSVLRIPGGVFNNNPNLEFIDFGDNVASIEFESFQNCPRLETIKIPYKWNSLHPWVGTIFPNLGRIIRRTQDGGEQDYPVQKIQNTYYYESGWRCIGDIKILKLHMLNFNANGISPETKTGIRINRVTTVGNNIHAAINNFRKHQISQEFERAIYIYDSKNQHHEQFDEHKSVLRHAMRRSLGHTNEMTIAMREKFHEYIRHIPTYIKYIDDVMKKYPNARGQIQELDDLTMDETLNIITPRPHDARVAQSCTRWLKRHPVSADEMIAIVRAGYKNPGAFPYSWLAKTPKKERGKLTQKLHTLFQTTTTKMYGPDNKTEFNQELAQMAQSLGRLIKQPVNIEYLESGNFSKTYTVQIPGDKKYVWKIYHSNRDGKIFTDWNHNTELQNSFLVSGRKYYGKMKFRKISVAGISNQRGEIYLIYPYTEYRNKIYPGGHITPTLKNFNIYDRNINNFCGDTVIDIGALRINNARLRQSRHVLKISNTILYHSWDDLTYILDKYSVPEISDACSFISKSLKPNSYQYKTIRDKIIYLRTHMR